MQPLPTIERETAPRELPDAIEDPDAVAEIETRRRLVHDDGARVLSEHPGAASGRRYLI